MSYIIIHSVGLHWSRYTIELGNYDKNHHLSGNSYIYIIYTYACTPYELACKTTKFKYACVRARTNTHTHSTLHERHTHHRSYINAHTCTFLLPHCINNNWVWSMIWLVGQSDGNYYAKSGSRLRFYNSAVGEQYNYFNNIIFYISWLHL